MPRTIDLMGFEAYRVFLFLYTFIIGTLIASRAENADFCF
jgi:hypothetical protein